MLNKGGKVNEEKITAVLMTGIMAMSLLQLLQQYMQKVMTITP